MNILCLFVFMILGFVSDLNSMNHRVYNNPHFSQEQNNFLNGKCTYHNYRPLIKLNYQFVRKYDSRTFKWFSNKAKELFEEKDFHMHAYSLEVDKYIECYGVEENYVGENRKPKSNLFLYAKFIFSDGTIKYMKVSIAKGFVYLDGKNRKSTEVIYHRGAKELNLNREEFNQMIDRKINQDGFTIDNILRCRIELYKPIEYN